LFRLLLALVALVVLLGGCFALLYVVLLGLTAAALPFGQEEAWDWMLGTESRTGQVLVSWEPWEGPGSPPSGLPVEGRITARFLDPRYQRAFGRPHWGVDIAVPVGTPVVATMGGKVVLAREHGGYGKLLIIVNGPWEVRLGHLSSFLVAEGQVVERGEVVALSGNTGASTGPHVHYEVRRDGKPVDPAGLP